MGIPFIIAGLIIEQIEFAKHVQIGEILIWSGVVLCVLNVVLWLIFGGLFAKEAKNIRHGF